jgi:DNA-binding transcriptional LysR family regulator
MDWTERIGRRLKPRDLHIFLAVAETGSMAKAAKALACSRPVVSKTIADLEATLGVRLLDRTAHGVEPTRYGNALRSRSIAVFDELRKSVKEIEFLADPGAGEVRIGATEPLMAGIVAAAIARSSRTYPRLEFRTEPGHVETMPQLLRSRKCELALIRQSPGPSEPDMHEERLFREHLRIVVGPGSHLARQRKVTLGDLTPEAWILAPLEAEPGGPVFEGFRAAGVEMPVVRLLSYSLSLRHSLLLTSPFITVIPGSALAFGPLKHIVKPLPIELPPWERPIVLMTLKDRSLSPAAEVFMQCIRELSPLAGVI